MDRFLLFIREIGREDILDFHPDRPAARTALISFVRRQNHPVSQPHPINDDVAVRRYFTREGAMYSIAHVRQAKRKPAR